jgi:hypothetical protein
LDGSRFDRLAKNLAQRSSRRSVLKGVGKAALAAVGLGGPIGTVIWSRESDAASCRDGGVSCTTHAQCCAGACGGPTPAVDGAAHAGSRSSPAAIAAASREMSV